MSKHLQQLFLDLGLQRIAAVLDDELGRAAAEATPVTELLQRLLSLESDARMERRAERRIKEAKLPDRKLLADFDFDFQKNIDKRQIMELATLEFAKRKQGLVFAGNSGTGAATHMSSVLAWLDSGFAACSAEPAVRRNAARILRPVMTG